MNPFSYSQRVARATNNFSNFGGNGASDLNQMNRTLTVVITNATNAVSSYILFGYNQYGTDATQGTGVTIAINQTSYNEVLRETANTPYEFVSAKFKSASSTNLDYVVTYTVREATGRIIQNTFTPVNYQEPENNNTELVRIPDFEGVILDGQTKFTASIAASSTVTYILMLRAKATLANTLGGQNVVDSTPLPAPNGMAPIQIAVAPTSMAGIPSGRDNAASQPGLTGNSRFY